MRDVVLINSMSDKNFDYNNIAMFSKIKAICNLRRNLDKQPCVINIKTETGGMSCSIMTTFITYYSDIVKNTCDNYIVSLPNCTKELSPCVHAVLKSLLYMSTHYDDDLASTASRMFSEIIRLPGSVISDKSLYEFIGSIKITDFYTTTLIQGIKKAVFSTNETIMHWRSISECGGWYVNAIKEGEKYIKNIPDMTPKQLDKMLAEAYKEAHAQKEWMSMLVRKVPTKPLIGMMWLLYKDNPEVMEPSIASGFMSAGATHGLSARTMDIDKVIKVYIIPSIDSGKEVSINENCFDEITSTIGICASGLVKSNSLVGALHVSKEGDFYVCRWIDDDE